MNKTKKVTVGLAYDTSWIWVVGSHCFYKTQALALLRQHYWRNLGNFPLQMCRELNTSTQATSLILKHKCTYLKYSWGRANCRLISATLIPPLGSQTCVTKPGISMFSSLKYKHSHTFHVNRCGTRSFINLSYAIYVCVSKSN
jgi:hypothetical protein